MKPEPTDPPRSGKRARRDQANRTGELVIDYRPRNVAQDRQAVMVAERGLRPARAALAPCEKPANATGITRAPGRALAA